MGSLSSWFILSSMGFYPVTPGSTFYAIGSPMFEKVSINNGNGKTFTISTSNNSSQNRYIQSATLNGKAITHTWISQKEISDGGVLTFQMGPEPNKRWGIKPEDAPPSMSVPWK